MTATLILLSYALLLGLVIGSFLNVCIYRIPNNMSVVFPPSSCPKCKNKIKWYDNIPLLSFIILRAKCRHCGQKISFEYPFVELLTGLLTVLFVWRFGISWWTPVVLTVVYCLVALSAIDLHTMMIPDRFSIGLTVFSLAFAFLNPAFSGTPWDKFLSALLGGSIGFFGLWGLAIFGQFAFKKEAMGGGDIKLMAAIGALAGWMGVINTLVVSSFAGIAYFGILMLLKKDLGDRTIPFGPFLSVGLLVNLLMPGQMLFY